MKKLKLKTLLEKFEPNRNNMGSFTFGSKKGIYFSDPAGKRDYFPTSEEWELFNNADGKTKDSLAKMWYPKSKSTKIKSKYYPLD